MNNVKTAKQQFEDIGYHYVESETFVYVFETVTFGRNNIYYYLFRNLYLNLYNKKFMPYVQTIQVDNEGKEQIDNTRFLDEIRFTIGEKMAILKLFVEKNIENKFITDFRGIPEEYLIYLEIEKGKK